MVEELLKPEFAVPTHEPTRLSHAPEAANSVTTEPRITITTRVERSQSHPVDIGDDTRLTSALSEEQPTQDDTLDTELRQHQSVTRGNGQTKRLSGWKSFLGLRPPVNLSKNVNQKLTSLQPTHFKTLLPSTPTISSRWSSTGSEPEASSIPTTISTISSSLASYKTSVDGHRIVAVKTSPAIYCLKKEPQIYLGHPLEMPMPIEMNKQWNQVIRQRLIVDIGSVSEALPGSLPQHKLAVEPAFCMVGESGTETDLVDLYPTVLIRCGCKRLRRAMEKALISLDYLQDFSGGRTLVIENAPRLASCQVTAEFPHLDQTHLGHQELRTALLDSSSSCSIPLACTTFDPTRTRLSLIGGLIKVDGIPYGLTTAHSIVETWPKGTSDDMYSSGTDSDSWDESPDSSTSSMTTLSPPPHEPASGEARCSKDQEYCKPKIDLNGYEDNAFLEAYSYGSHRVPHSKTNAYAVSERGDFALINLAQKYQHLPNKYVASSEHRITEITSAESCSGPVSIVCSSSDVRPACLLDDDHLFMSGPTVFCTKKLQTKVPLGQSQRSPGESADKNAGQGLSGAWVASGNQLLGMIIAVYDEEPYVHMLEMTSIFSDIRALMSSGDRIPQVVLLEHPLLEPTLLERPCSTEPSNYSRNGLSDQTFLESQTYPEFELNEKGMMKAEPLLKSRSRTMKEYLMQKFTVVGSKDKELVGKYSSPTHTSIRNQIVLGLILFTSFCTKLVSLFSQQCSHNVTLGRMMLCYHFCCGMSQTPLRP